MQRHARPARPLERGVTAVLVAAMLAALAAFMVLVINVGHLFSVHGELQNGADSAAIAGALQLNGQIAGTPDADCTPTRPCGLDRAVTDATTYAGLHRTDGSVQVVPSVVELGHWAPPPEACLAGEAARGVTGPHGAVFCLVTGRTPLDALRIDAVRVAAVRAAGEAGGGAAPVFGGGAVGSGPTADVRTEAVAVAGGPANTACPALPFVLRSQCLIGASGLKCGQVFALGLSNATIDTAGWTALDPTKSNPSPNDVCDYLKNPPANCAVGTGTRIGTNNGNNLSGNNCKPPQGKNQTLCEWFKAWEGKTVEVPVVDYDDGKGCSGGYQGWATVTGFATLQIGDVYCKQPGEKTPTGACSAFATSQCVTASFECNQQDHGGSPGGNWYGTAARPALVR